MKLSEVSCWVLKYQKADTDKQKKICLSKIYENHKGFIIGAILAYIKPKGIRLTSDEITELTHECFIGMFPYILTYEPCYLFSTYSVWGIRKAIDIYFNQKRPLIKSSNETISENVMSISLDTWEKIKPVIKSNNGTKLVDEKVIVDIETWKRIKPLLPPDTIDGARQISIKKKITHYAKTVSLNAPSKCGDPTYDDRLDSLTDGSEPIAQFDILEKLKPLLTKEQLEEIKHTHFVYKYYGPQHREFPLDKSKRWNTYKRLRNKYINGQINRPKPKITPLAARVLKGYIKNQYKHQQ